MTIKLADREPRKRTETTRVREILGALNRIPGVRAVRNNTGRTPVPCDACRRKLCRGCAGRLAYPVVFGLGDGGPDIVGLVTLAHADAVLAVPFGIEVKSEGKTTEPHQLAWHRVAAAKGMRVASPVYEPEAAVAFVEELRARAWLAISTLAGAP